MKQQTTASMDETEVTIRLPLDLQRQVYDIASQQGETPSEVICLAVASYITTHAAHHRAAPQRLTQQEARALMREFGRGVGHGKPPHDGARAHDSYLYGKA